MKSGQEGPCRRLELPDIKFLSTRIVPLSTRSISEEEQNVYAYDLMGLQPYKLIQMEDMKCSGLTSPKRF